MDAKGLTEQGRQLIKAFDGGDPPATLLSLLSPLEQWTPTEDLLRASKIGVAVAKIRASKDPKVASLASNLVNKWKAAVKKKGVQATGSPAATGKAGANVMANGRSATDSPAPKNPVVAVAPKKYSVAPEKRTAKEDGVDTAITGDQIRDACIGMIYNGLVFMSEEAPADILAVSRDVEDAAFVVFERKTSPTYKAKMRSLHLNLKMKTSDQLRKGVFSGAIPPKRFVTMSTEELKSEEKRKSDAAMQKENMNNSMAPQEEKAISQTMQCGKCKEYKVAYTQAQTRSADEPMTVFCECTNCGNRWKFSG